MMKTKERFIQLQKEVYELKDKYKYRLVDKKQIHRTIRRKQRSLINLKSTLKKESELSI